VTFVKAYQKMDGKKKQIWYEDETGPKMIHEGGSRSWRNNNPGNLRFKNPGSIGMDDDKFSIFPDVETGRRAKIQLLRGKYGGYESVHQMLGGKFDGKSKYINATAYAPKSDQNDPAKYAAFIQQKTGFDVESKKMSEFTDDEIGKIVLAMRDKEGWTAGTEMDVPSAVPKTTPFDDIAKLEELAIKDGYDVIRRITAFRKLWYDARNKSYGGVAFRVGAWDLLIPGAKGTSLPPTWLASENAALVEKVIKAKTLSLQGMAVDISHVFAGADARNHPSKVELAAFALRSNVEATTWVGDLGSVVVEYVHHTKEKDAQTRRTSDLERFFDMDPSVAVFDLEDQASDLDGILCDFPASGTIHQTLNAYYADNGPWKTRSKIFLSKVLSTAQNGLQDEVFKAAMAYAAAKGWLSDIDQIYSKPRPGFHLDIPHIGRIDEYSLWELYFNNSTWVIDILRERLNARAVG
jgi:hypothetical protein